MDLMLLDAHFADSLPAEVLGGDIERCEIGESESTNEARLFLFAKDLSGISYCLTILGYKPWIRIMNRSGQASKSSLESLLSAAFNIDKSAISIVEEKKPQFYGYAPGNGTNPKNWLCYKIYFPTFTMASKAEQLWKFSNSFGSAAMAKAKHKLRLDFEITDELFPIAKAFNELDLTPSQWFHVSEHMYSPTIFSTCKKHLDVKAKAISPRPLLTAVAPLKVLSFDAEMYSQDNSFPEVLHGDIIMALCASILIYGTKEFQRHAFILDFGTKITLNGVTVYHCSDPLDLMDQFRDLIAREDPDILTGWNIYGFDMPYMWDSYQDTFKARFQRGSEKMHRDCLTALGRQTGFLSVAELLKGKQGIESKAFIDKMEMRHKLNLRDPQKLPEFIACELRRLLRQEQSLKSEQSQNNCFGGLADFEFLKKNEIYRFAEVFEPPRIESAKRFERLGRICADRSSLKEKRMVSGAKGDNTYYFWSGRPTIDLMHVIKDDKKLESNTLKFIAQTFLDPEYGKIDMGPHEIFAAWREKNPQKIKDMLEYCMRDADIPNLLIQKMSYLPIWVEKSRVTCTTIQQLMNGGQQRSIHNLLSRFIRDSHIFNKGQSGWPITDYEFEDDEESKKRKADYQGATVIEPTPGYYIAPEHPCVSTLDFESLYPSIMVHFNLCPSVFLGANIDTAKVPSELVVETHTIKHSILKDFKEDTYNDFENTYSFVKNVQGVIPRLLQHLLAARKIAKRAMNSAPDEFERSVQNSRQLALKTSCNSVYGFFGVRQDKGLCSFKPASAVTTLWGRNFLEHAKAYVEKHYTGSKVLYGDTDSIMISWGRAITEVHEAYKLAEEASAAITQLLRNGSIGQKPVLDSASCAVTLANEKVYTSFLLIQKKMYAAMKYTLKNGQKPLGPLNFENCVDMKGIDAVRRDRTKMVKMLSEKILDSLLIDQDLAKALETLKNTLDMVSNQKAPLDWLVLSKSLKSSYVSQNQPHVQARMRMIARGSQNVPEIGDRMPYIIVSNGKTGPLYERTEHPEFFEPLKLKYCAKYYLENARDVIERLLGPTGKLKEVSHLFTEALNVAELKASGQMSLKAFFKRRRDE